MKRETCAACGRAVTKRNPAVFRVATRPAGCRQCTATPKAYETEGGPERIRPARSSKMLRRSMEASDGLGFVPTRYAVRMGRRITPAA